MKGFTLTIFLFLNCISLVNAASVRVFDGEITVNADLNGTNIDINNDGFNDINFRWAAYSVNHWEALVRWAGYNTAYISESFAEWPSAAIYYNQGDEIGYSTVFSSHSGVRLAFSDGSGSQYREGGYFLNENGFIGYAFQIESEWHWGWAEVGINVGSSAELGNISIFSYGYETISREATFAGLPTTVPVPPAFILFLFGLIGLMPFTRKTSNKEI